MPMVASRCVEDLDRKDDNSTSNRNSGQLQSSNNHQAGTAWWGDHFNLRRPVLFGTWDGVFSACMLNIFGVIIFLRTGWIVSNAGLYLSIVIVLVTMSIAVVTVLSAIGICQKGGVSCTGGVYSLIRHVLGARVATPFSLLYVLSQGIACSLCVLVFSHSIVHLFGCEGCVWVEKVISCVTLVVILGVTGLGVTWVVGLHIILVCILFIAIADFVIGSFITKDEANGIHGYSRELLASNSFSDFREGENFFGVLGVFVPMSAGIFAGFNMHNDLKNPRHNIPAGTIASIALSTGIYCLFAFIMAATCERKTLLNDNMIAEKIAASETLWLVGLYELSLASAVGNLCGCPVALQAIAADHVLSFLKPLALGRGPNKVPLVATAVLTVVCMLFVLVGQVNSLSKLTTILFLLSYSSVNYSYFILSMSLRQNGRWDGRKDGVGGGFKSMEEDGGGLTDMFNLNSKKGNNQTNKAKSKKKGNLEKYAKNNNKNSKNNKSKKNKMNNNKDENNNPNKNGDRRGVSLPLLAKQTETYGALEYTLKYDIESRNYYYENDITTLNEGATFQEGTSLNNREALRNMKFILHQIIPSSSKNLFESSSSTSKQQQQQQQEPLQQQQQQQQQQEPLQQQLLHLQLPPQHPQLPQSHPQPPQQPPPHPPQPPQQPPPLSPPPVSSLFSLSKFPSDLQINQGDWLFFPFCNYWVSLLCSISCLVSIVLIDWAMTSMCVLSLFSMWLLIGILNPGTQPGVANFSYKQWLKDTLCFFLLKRNEYMQVVIYPSFPKVPLEVSNQTSTNEDMSKIFWEVHRIKFTKELNLYPL